MLRTKRPMEDVRWETRYRPQPVDVSVTIEREVNLGEIYYDTFDVDCRITSHGCSGSGPSWSSPGEPDEPAEFEYARPVVSSSGVLVSLLTYEEHEKVNEAVQEYDREPLDFSDE